MAEALQTVRELSGKVAAIVGGARVFTDGDLLDKYSTNAGCSRTGRPDMVAQVTTRDEIKALVKLANETGVPVVPRSSATGFYGGAVPEQGGIVIDMSGMKRIMRIDEKNRWVLIEPGVTYGELQAELAKIGMTALLPLAPHPDKSVITSCLEREPKLTPKHHLDETILTMELVLPTGAFFHTGSMSVSPAPPEKVSEDAHTDLCNFMGPGLDWFRLIPGSLGSYSIVTAMNMKIAIKPKTQKLVFFGFKSLQDSVEPWYYLLRKLIGNECLLLNSRYLALLLAREAGDIERLQAALPAYTILLNLTAGEHRPEEKMAYLEKAVQDASRIYQLQPMETLPHAQDAAPALQTILSGPWADGADYWKWRGRGASREVFFLTQLQRAPEFLREIEAAAAVGNDRARLALDAFCYKVKRYVGAMLIVLGGCDALVFTGGIGSNSPTVRAKILEGTEKLGFLIDAEKNARTRTNRDNEVEDISAESSPIAILVIETFEELMMARQCLKVVGH